MEYRQKNHRCERDRGGMVLPKFPGNRKPERNKKRTVARVSQLRVPLCFFFVLPSHSLEKMAKSFQMKCRY